MDAGNEKSSVIVVGIDGSESSLQALHWAVTQAKATGATLEAVMAWVSPTFWGRTPTWPPGQDPEEETRRGLAEAVESVLGPHGASDVQEVVVEGHPASALIAASEHADLLVVGSSGHGAFVGHVVRFGKPALCCQCRMSRGGRASSITRGAVRSHATRVRAAAEAFKSEHIRRPRPDGLNQILGLASALGAMAIREPRRPCPIPLSRPPGDRDSGPLGLEGRSTRGRGVCGPRPRGP